MPELPEVETIARRIRPHLLGKQLCKIVVCHKKSVLGDPLLLRLAILSKVSRKAKMLVLHFDNHYHLLIHLKMTGQILYQDSKIKIGGGHPTADWISQLPSKHTRAILEFSDSSKVFFNDMRVFGWMKILDADQLDQELRKYAPDVIAPEVTAKYFFAKLQHTKRPIKTVIMDQAVIAGVGNIYANDALHLAKIYPGKPANSLSFTEAKLLLESLREVIQLGIKKQGATIDSFRHIDGFAGSYQDVTRVYGKDGSPCLVCNTTLVRNKLGGRGTFFCPQCQPSDIKDIV